MEFTDYISYGVHTLVSIVFEHPTIAVFTFGVEYWKNCGVFCLVTLR